MSLKYYLAWFLPSILFILNISQTRAQDIELIYTLAVAWSHNGQYLASASVQPDELNGYLQVIDAETMSLEYSFESQQGGFTSVTWSPDDQFIAAGNFDGTVWIFDLTEDRQIATLRGHQSTISSVDWDSSGTRLVSGGNWDELVILWDMTTYQRITDLKMTATISNVEFSPNDEQIAVTNEIGLFVFPATLDVSANHNQIVADRIRALAWSPDGVYIAVGVETIASHTGNQQNATLYTVDARTLSIIQRYTIPSEAIMSVDWSPDSRFIAIYNNNDSVNLLDTTNANIIGYFAGEGTSRYSINSLDFSLYGGRLAYGTVTNSTSQQSNRGTSHVEGIVIVVPNPSIDLLQTIAQACNAPLPIIESLNSSIATNQLSNLITQLESLPIDSIPPACAADLIAVAEAIQSQ